MNCLDCLISRIVLNVIGSNVVAWVFIKLSALYRYAGVFV
jgi:hypothetical protein